MGVGLTVWRRWVPPVSCTWSGKQPVPLPPPVARASSVKVCSLLLSWHWRTLPVHCPPAAHLFKAPANCVGGGAAAQGGIGEEDLPQLCRGAGGVGAAARL